MQNKSRSNYLDMMGINDNWKNQLDEYCIFEWNGVSSKNFNAFIISDGSNNTLKFYNGPSFSNEYSNPQFESANSTLLGVSFETQQIKFKIGIFGFHIDMYRRIIQWLNPYTIADLSFNFDSKYRYLVKLSGREESARYFIRQDANGPIYYTEFNLTFEIQGEACAIGQEGYEWIEEASADQDVRLIKVKQTNDYIPTDLDTPILMNLELELKKKIAEDQNTSILNENLQIQATAEYTDDSGTTSSITMFHINLQNLYEQLYVNDSEVANLGEPMKLNIRYDSEAGLAYLQYGDSTFKLLSLTTTAEEGQRIVNRFTVNKFKILGRLETDWHLNNGSDLIDILPKMRFKIRIFKEEAPADFLPLIDYLKNWTIESYPRTNVL